MHAGQPRAPDPHSPDRSWLDSSANDPAQDASRDACLSAPAQHPLSAAAQQEQALEGVVVRNRLYRPAGNLELSPSVGVSMLTYLTAHYTLDLGVAYNLFDTIAVEGRAGYAFSRQTGLARSISESFLSRDDKKITDELEDLWRMNLHAVAGLRWASVYGKLSLMSEVPAHFQAYLWAGGGLGSFQRRSLIQSAIPGHSDAIV